MSSSFRMNEVLKKAGMPPLAFTGGDKDETFIALLENIIERINKQSAYCINLQLALEGAKLDSVTKARLSVLRADMPSVTRV